MAHQSHDEAVLAELLDLDGDVLRAFLGEVTAWVRQAARSGPRQRVVDLGAGTGTGTIALAQRFAGAEVIAVDASELMLRRVRAKALDLGLAQRIRTVQADLDDRWPPIELVDVVWASLSLHHVADPDRLLADLFAATRPGGLLAVVEFSAPLRFLPDDVGVGRPGLEARCLEVLREEHAHAVPTVGTDWAPRLTRAGFTQLCERVFDIEVGPPYPAGARRYAALWLQRMRSVAAGGLEQADLDALDVLLDSDGPHSVQRREDLRIAGTRTVTLARRP